MLAISQYTIAMIPTLIAAGSVAHASNSATRSGSFVVFCVAFSVSTALTTATSRFSTFKTALFSSVSVD